MRSGILPGVILFASLAVSLHSQTIEDGIMLSRHTLFTGNIYTHDSWNQYWEGSLRRVNGNLGTVSTQTDTWYADYGVTNRLNAIVSVPYVWTHPSQGVLHDMQGYQDINVAAKYNFFNRPFTRYGDIRAIAAAYGSLPLTDYEPAFQPLSIGNHSKRIAARLTLNFQSHRGWFGNASSSYAWRSDVTLDQPYYYTNGQLYLTDQVSMPEVFDYIVSGGYLKRGLMAEGTFSQLRTQGGGDIRRQDAPFISNHINFSKVGATIMHPLPKLHDLSFQFAFAYTVDGRNVGQATTYSTGLLYTVRFPGSLHR